VNPKFLLLFSEFFVHAKTDETVSTEKSKKNERTKRVSFERGRFFFFFWSFIGWAELSKSGGKNEKKKVVAQRPESKESRGIIIGQYQVHTSLLGGLLEVGDDICITRQEKP